MMGARSVLCMQSCVSPPLLGLRRPPPSLAWLRPYRYLVLVLSRRIRHHHHHRSAPRPYLRVVRLRLRGTANRFLPGSLLLPLLPPHGHGENLHAGEDRLTSALRVIEEEVLRHDDDSGGAMSRFRSGPRTRREDPVPVGARPPRRGGRRRCKDRGRTCIGCT